MDTTTAVVATGLVVGTGRWAQEKTIGMKMFIGLAATAIFLAILSSSNDKIAGQFAVLILVTAVLIYGVDIGKKLGGLK